MASDSILVRWCTQTTNNTKFTKLWEAGPLVIGSVGEAQEAALMRLFSENHQPESSDQRGVLAFMGEFGAWKKGRTESGALANAYLIGIDRQVFHASGMFVEQVVTHESIGAGMDYALAAMECGADPWRAVEVAIALSIYCAAPVQTIRKRSQA